MDSYSLVVNNLSKKMPKFWLKNVTFSLPKGAIMALVGPNGAGKTTTVKIILNMMDKIQGSACVLGFDSVKYDLRIRQKTTVVFDTNMYSDTWKVSRLEKTIAPFYNEWNHNIFMEKLMEFQISPDDKVCELSQGMKMRLIFATAYARNSKLFIIDEPVAGFDPNERYELIGLLQDYISDGERSVLYATHNTSDLIKYADYITVLSQGEVKYTGKPESLLDRYIVVKGITKEIEVELKKHLIDLYRTKMGYEGWIGFEHAEFYHNYILEQPSMDDLINFISRGGENRCPHF